VAIAKEKFGSEEFTRHYWPPPAEIYFDSKKEGYPFFKTTNGEKQDIVRMAVSYLLGGSAAQNWRNADPKIPSSMLGSAGTVLGSVMVVSRTGEVLFHHKEGMVGDPPNPFYLEQAIKKLGGTGVASCECEGEDEDAKDDVKDDIKGDGKGDGKD